MAKLDELHMGDMHQIAVSVCVFVSVYVNIAFWPSTLANMWVPKGLCAVTHISAKFVGWELVHLIRFEEKTTLMG